MAKLEDAFINFMSAFGDGNPFGIFKMDDNNKQRFEFLTSSLRKATDGNCTLEDAKQYAITDILQHVNTIPANLPQVTELPEGEPFNFMARVDMRSGDYNIETLIKKSNARNFLPYSLITNKNISHYKTKHPFILLYNVPAEAIVHIFPSDADTNLMAANESEVSGLPSLWLNYDELTGISDQIGTYNQITCKTNVNGNILLPCGILVFDKLNDEAQQVSNSLNLPIVIAHPNKDAINYVGDGCMFDSDKQTAEMYIKTVEVLRKTFIRCFKTKNEKRIFEDFISSFNVETAQQIIAMQNF